MAMVDEAEAFELWEKLLCVLLQSNSGRGTSDGWHHKQHLF